MFRFDRDSLRVRSPHAFAEQREIRFQEADPAGIIFYSRLFDLCHDTWAKWLELTGCSLQQALADKTFLFPIRHAEADYFKPLRFGDRVEVALSLAHLEESEVTLGFRIAREHAGEVCAVAQSVHVCLAAASFTRRPLPEPIRAALSRMRPA